MLNLPKTPLDPFALLVKAWDLFKFSLPQILSLSIVLAFLGVMMTGAIEQQIDIDKPDWWREVLSSDLMPYLVLYGVLSTYLGNILLFRIGQLYLPKMVDQDPYQRAWAALLPMLVANVLYVTLVFAGSLAFVIPGVFLLVSLLFYAPAILFDKKGIVPSLAFSAYLVKDNWWHTASVFALPLLGFFVCSGLLNEYFAGQDTEQMGYLKQVVDIAVDSLFTPFIYSVTLVTFYDLKLRRLPKGDDDYLAA